MEILHAQRMKEFLNGDTACSEDEGDGCRKKHMPSSSTPFQQVIFVPVPKKELCHIMDVCLQL